MMVVSSSSDASATNFVVDNHVFNHPTPAGHERKATRVAMPTMRPSHRATKRSTPEAAIIV
jgi:hypothetical protein